MPTVREYEQIIQRDAADSEAFLALRKAYRESGKLDKLVVLYEYRAQALDDAAKAAELFYLAAEVRLDQLSDASGAEADLAHAVDKDPNHLKATKRLKDMYREQGRTADYMTMLELEAAAVARSKEPARMGELQLEMNQLSTQLTKLEKTLSNPATRGEVTADQLKVIESARKIYRALGDFQHVVRLYEVELGATTDAKRRADLLLGFGKVLAGQVGDLDGAAQRIGEVVRLRPRDDKALEALAGVYAHPQWIGTDGADRAAALYHQVARRRQEAGDVDNAVAALRKGLAAVPGHSECSELLERVLYDAGRLADLDRYYRERVAAARSTEERMDFLFKRAQLAEGDLDNADESLRIYEEIVAIEPPGGPASQHLAELYLANQDYGKLAELREKQLAGATDPTFRMALLTELAALYRDRLGDAEQSAVYLHAILELDPNNAEALQAYAEHFRQRGEWKELVDLLEFSFDLAQQGGLPADQQLPRLEEIATLAEGKLNDGERALTAWQRIEEVSPGYERAREAQKRLLLKSKQWERLASLLEREAAATSEPTQRVEVLRRLARVYIDKLEMPDRAVAVHQDILALDPRDVVALRALTDNYEKAARWEDLGRLLRDQLELAPGKPEKVTVLRRLLALYEERVIDATQASWAAQQILEMAPGDREAMTRLEAIYERTDDKVHLVEALENHTKHAATPEERVSLLHRIADLLHNHLGQVERATYYWEQLAKLAPDATALDALAAAYEKLGRSDDLARILEQRLERPGVDAATTAECLRHLAHLGAGPLAQPERAQRAWEDLLKVMPTDREALAALEKIYRDQGEWRSLVGIIERRIPLAEDPQSSVTLALERARVLEEELRNGDEALHALDQIVTELDPRSVEAHDRLRRVAESKQDWARVVSVAERRLFLTEEGEERVERALEIGALWRDRLNEPAKALGAFERVIELDASNEAALRALAPLYASSGDGERLVSTDERLLEYAQDADERRRLMFEIAATCQASLNEPRRAFDWYRRAYQERSDDETLARLESVADAYDLWEDLVQVYAGERARSSDQTEQVDVAIKVAGLCESRLRNPARALTVLREALSADPTGTRLLPEVERLAAETGDWKGLLDVYAQVARARPAPEERVELLRRRATVREERLADAGGALDEHLRAFALAPESEETQREILRLAERTGRWEDALGVQAQLFARAGSTEAKVEVARRAAALVEDKVRDRVRAFRAYLNAFRLAPDDEGIVSNVWRLAALIGRYEPEESEEIEDISEEIEEIEEGAAADSERTAPTYVPIGLGVVRQGENTPWEELANAYEQLPVSDESGRHRHLLRVADVWERGAKDLDRALATLERAFQADLGDTAAKDQLVRLAGEHDRWDQVCDIFLRAVELAPREQAVALQHEVARYRERLGQVAANEDRYLAILTLQPEDASALDHLEQLYRQQERWVDLAGILEKRTTGSAEALPPGPARRAKALELADITERLLERPHEAIDTLERYVAAIDDDERGADHPDVIREAAGAYQSLVRLYSRVASWQKAVAALQKQIDLTADKQAVRDLRWRAAEILEREQGAGEQAVLMLDAILTDIPDDEEALAALDRLHQAHGRYEALQDVLRRRAELTSGTARTELIRRRAKILEDRLGNPDAAAACLRSLGAEALSDDEATAALLRNLRSAGLAHEALRVLAQRLELLAKNKVEPTRLAGLHLELADLRLRQLGDPGGARQAIEAALALVPEDDAALEALARLFLEQNDFAAFAEVRLRQARAKPGTTAALLEAGAVYRDQLGNPSEARMCFERAVAEQPSDPEALHALASLLAAEGNLREALAHYERQLTLVDSPAGKAAVLTDIARVLREIPGESATAVARLDEALELSPDHLPAVVTMADIYYKEQQWEQAERRLAQVLRRTRGEPEERARLYYRLAEVYEKLGRLDEGYRQLMEADRVAPGQLLIRIALGDNRFQARKWRESAGHLEGVADHPDAARYPDEVAQALAHGAQAEIKLKRPERAVAMYTAALRFSPDHLPSLKALADLALERGEKREAAQYLRRVAESSGDRAERVQLFEQLGDLYHALDESEAARDSYQQAAMMIERPEERHVPLLEKTLLLERTGGAVGDAAQTALRLADAVTSPRDRGFWRAEAASLLVSQGDHVRAASVLDRALADNPLDEQVLVQTVAAYERSDRADEIEALLARTLPELPPVADRPVARARRADLWQRLGERRRRKDPAGAVEALERAVEADPERIESRLALTALYGDRPEYAEAATRNNRMLVHGDITRPEPLRALAAAYVAQGRLDRARCCYEVLELLGAAGESDRAFLAAHPAPVLKPDDPYSGTIEEIDRARLLAHPDARVLAEVFASMWEGVPGLGKSTLESLGVGAQDKVSPLSDQDLGKVYGQISKALGNKRTNLYISPDPAFEGMALVVAPPPAIVVDQRIAAAGVAELRFRLGRGLELTRAEYILAATIPPREFAQLFSSVLKAFHPRHARWRAGEKGAEQAARLKKALPYKVAKRLAELFTENDATPFSSAKWRTVVLETGARAGLLMCGDLRAAAQVLVTEDSPGAEVTAETLRTAARAKTPLRELLRYAISDEYFTLRESLGTSVTKAAA